jgi:DNA gyrase subunit A
MPEKIKNEEAAKDTNETLEIPNEQFFVFATSLGNVRRNKLDDFANIPSNGKRAMKLEDDEKLIGVKLCCEQDDIMLFTKQGLCNRFNVDNIRIFAGRDSNGVRGIRLQEKDFVIGLTILTQGKIPLEERDAYLRYASKIRQGLGDEGSNINDESVESDDNGAEITLSPERIQQLADQEQFILTLTENGFGKRSSAYQYRTTNRGGVGMDSIIVNIRNGGVIASFPVNDMDDIMLVTNNGQLIRCPVKDIRITGRRTQGVIIFRIDDGEKVVSVSRIPSQEGDDEKEIEEIEEIEDNVMPS